MIVSSCPQSHDTGGQHTKTESQRRWTSRLRSLGSRYGDRYAITVKQVDGHDDGPNPPWKSFDSAVRHIRRQSGRWYFPYYSRLLLSPSAHSASSNRVTHSFPGREGNYRYWLDLDCLDHCQMSFSQRAVKTDLLTCQAQRTRP